MDARPSSARPGSARGKTRMDPNAAGNAGQAAAVKVYQNNLYESPQYHGDVLAGEADSIAAHRPAAPAAGNTSGNQKLQQHRAMNAQKRLDRIQLAGVAVSNDGGLLGGRPGTPGSPGRSAPGTPSGATAVGNGSLRPAVASTLSPLTPKSGTAAGYEQSSAASESLVFRTASDAEKNLLAKGLATVYDPTEDDDAHQGRSRPASARHGAMPARLEINDLAAFLTQPGPKSGPVLCYIEREKNGFGMKSHRYRMFLDDGRKFLLAARKRNKSAHSNYTISSNADDLSLHSDCYLGKCGANMIGTEFVIYDDGIGPGKKTGGRPRRELGAVLYQYNVLGTRGPRRMTAAIPALDARGNSRFQPTGPDDSILDRLKGSRDLTDLVVLKNKPPKWNDQLNAYCLNFSGRVTEASVKNLQLVTDDAVDTVVLQFGKIANETFTCDFQYPMTPLQAFSVCLSSFDKKLACE
eukprot:jgi/Chrzof1/10959/Cz05g18210.t1